MTRLLAYDHIRIAKPVIISETKRFLKVAAVITKPGVYKYEDGYALKPATELRKATRTARYAKLTIADHPETKVIMSPGDLYGGIEKPFWDFNKMRAVLVFDKEFCSEDVLTPIRNGEARDVSIGFYYKPDFTPGWGPDVNTGKIIRYKYVMRDILIDHVVTAVKEGTRGRCTFPSCGIGVDAVFSRLSVAEDKVVKRGEKWCVVHCHADGKIGSVIKCFSGPDAKNRAEAMHRAIQASKNKTALMDTLMCIIKGDAEKPPKEWMDNCMARAQSFADEPGAFCMWLYNRGPDKLRRSMGALQSTKGDDRMSEEKSAFEKCVDAAMEAGATRTEAEEQCKEHKTDQAQEKTAYEACLAEKKEAGMTDAEAEEACEPLKPKAADQEGEKTPWQLCIQKWMATGLDKEQARMKCKEEGVKQDQEAETAPQAQTPALPTPLEACIANRMEAEGEDEATAKAWCEDELAGLHQPAEDIVASIRKLQAQEKKLAERKR